MDKSDKNLIGFKIRKLLLNIDLKIVYAEGARKVAIQDFNLNQKIQTTENQRKAMQAKIRRDCYAIYIQNLNDTKREIEVDLDKILSTYTPKHKEIWVMYFIKSMRLDDIARETNYTRENVCKIIHKLKDDLCEYYQEETKKKKGGE